MEFSSGFKGLIFVSNISLLPCICAQYFIFLERDENVFGRNVSVNDALCSSGYRPSRESR